MLRLCSKYVSMTFPPYLLSVKVQQVTVLIVCTLLNSEFYSELACVGYLAQMRLVCAISGVVVGHNLFSMQR